MSPTVRQRVRGELLRYHVEPPDRFDDDPSSMHPLILFLHGGGENGAKGGRDDVQQVTFHGPWKSHGSTDYPAKGPEAKDRIGRFIVVAPHLSDDVEWEPSAVRDVLNDVLRKRRYATRVDRRAIYL